VTDPPGDLPAPAQYRVLPEIEAAAAVRSGPAASIFPMVYYDLVRWIDIADVAQQVFEFQLPFSRPDGPRES
jgi:hypothetical protein